MTWIKLEVDIGDHPKIAEAGPLASWLFVMSVCYSRRLLTDGFVPSAQVPKLISTPRPNVLAAKLVRSGLWDEVEGGWMIHDYAEWQATKEQVKADRKVAAERKSRQRSRDSHAVTQAVVTRPKDAGLTAVEVEKKKSRERVDRKTEGQGRLATASLPKKSRPHKDAAHALTVSVIEKSVHKPAQRFTTIMAAIERCLDVGWEGDQVEAAALDARTITVGWLEAELNKRKTNGHSPKSQASTQSLRNFLETQAVQ